MPETATGGVLQKRCSLKCRKNIYFKQQPKRLFWKCGHCNNEAKEIDCLCCRELDAMLYLLRLKSQSVREVSHHLAFMRICPTITYTY